MLYKKSSALFEEAYKYLPGGVNSPALAFKSVGSIPIVMKSAKAAYLKDADDNTYIDYLNSWGSAILGHANSEVLEAVRLQMEKGFSFGTPTEPEIELAKLIVENVSNIDQIRMVSSETEACMSAVRLARAFTGKDKIIKFEGCYHGDSDFFQKQMGNMTATYGNRDLPGVTKGVTNDILVAEYNNFEQVEDIFKINPEIAAIIVEPIAGNMGCILPENQFLQNLRKICDVKNTLLIFDETKTGFRLAFGGAQEALSVKADIVIFGKIIGGGFPVAAFAARNEIMDHIVPKGRVYQSGNTSGDPVAMCAGLKTLQLIKQDPEFYNKINKTAETLDFEIGKILNSKDIRHRINRKGSMMSIFFHATSVSNFREANDSDIGLFNNLFHQVLEQGIYLPPSGYESWFVSSAIGDTEIDKTLEAFRNFQY